MKRGWKAAAFAAAFSISFTTAAFASEITSQKMVELTNKSRQEAGLKALETNGKLEAAARKKAADMLRNQYFEHVSPSGVTPWFWFDDCGYDYIYAAENLAMDFTTAEGAHSALMKSPGHRDNILGVSYKDIGVATVEGEFKGEETMIIVQMFASTRQQNKVNESFYETEVSARPRTVPGATAEAEAKENPSEEKRVEVADTAGGGNQIGPILIEQAAAQSVSEPVRAKEAGIGKIVPETSAIKGMGRLKAVYTEDIFWKMAEAENGLGRELSSERARLKYILRNLTSGHCCKPLG